MYETKIDLHEVYERLDCQTLREASSEAAKAGNADEAEFWGCALNKFMQAINGRKDDNMATETVNGRRIVAHGKDRDFTLDEIWELNKRICAAEERGDEAEADRLTAQMPVSPRIAAGFKRIFGAAGVELLKDFDLTEANLAFGEGWIDE